jgi:hypothetical protein
MVQSILKDSPENRAILLNSSVVWPGESNGQVLSVKGESQNHYPEISWDETYALIKKASRLLLPANI